jgi:prepilin peptidase CpaA
MLIAFSLGGIGGGDVKLAGAIGALVGCPMVIHAMLYGFIAAAVVGIGLIVVKRMTRQTAGRLVQFFWLLMTGVRPNDPTTARSPRLATALPWAIGAIAAVAQYQWIPWLTTGVVWVTGKPFGT